MAVPSIPSALRARSRKSLFEKGESVITHRFLALNLLVAITSSRSFWMIFCRSGESSRFHLIVFPDAAEEENEQIARRFQPCRKFVEIGQDKVINYYCPSKRVISKIVPPSLSGRAALLGLSGNCQETLHFRRLENALPLRAVRFGRDANRPCGIGRVYARKAALLLDSAG